jgi:DNA-binding XRE family transcriptional regulator
MKPAKRKCLERNGWRVGTSKQFLGLSDEEVVYIELKLALSERLRSTRERKGVTQAGLAKLTGSSQSRVAKMESGDPTVSIDLLVKSLLALGATRTQIAGAFKSARIS